MRIRELLFLVPFVALTLVACSGPRWSGSLEPPAVDPSPSETAAPASKVSAPKSPSPTPATSTPSPASVATPSALGQLAFVRDGDVWVEELPGGTPRPVTRDGHDDTPRWSGSGTWLSFIRHDPGGTSEHLWVVNPSTGESHEVYSGEAFDQSPEDRFAWSPGGIGATDRLAFVSNGSLMLTSLDGDRRAREVVAERQPAGLGVTGIAWSPDGTWLAYTRVVDLTPGPSGGGRRLRASLEKVHPDGSDRTMVVNADQPPGGDLFLAGWTPDGARILFWKEGIFSASLLADGVGLLAVPAAGGTPTQVVGSMLAYPDFLSASPDGRHLVVVDGGGRETWTGKTLAVSDLGGPIHRMTNPDGVALFPSWSPDGGMIAFVNQPESPLTDGPDVLPTASQRQIWLVSADASNPRRLTGNPAYRDERPEWSADGKTILFARLRDSGASLWTIAADGSNLRPVVNELSPAPASFGYYGYIRWTRFYDWWRGPNTGPGLPVVDGR